MEQSIQPTSTPPKKSWPLFLLAGLSLIPVFGVLAGFVVACWGLLTDRPRGILAAALGGAGAILNVAVLAVVGMSMMRDSPTFKGVALGIARVELDTLAAHLETYRSEHGRYPTALTDLPRTLPRGLPLIDHSQSLLNTTAMYQYRPSSDGQDYHLAGAGPDGVSDTPDDLLRSTVIDTSISDD